MKALFSTSVQPNLQLKKSTCVQESRRKYDGIEILVISLIRTSKTVNKFDIIFQDVAVLKRRYSVGVICGRETAGKMRIVDRSISLIVVYILLRNLRSRPDLKACFLSTPSDPKRMSQICLNLDDLVHRYI
jgi:hypothetical protein